MVPQVVLLLPTECNARFRRHFRRKHTQGAEGNPRLSNVRDRWDDRETEPDAIMYTDDSHFSRPCIDGSPHNPPHPALDPNCKSLSFADTEGRGRHSPIRVLQGRSLAPPRPRPFPAVTEECGHLRYTP